MASEDNITWPIISGILAVINIIVGFIVFPLKKQVDGNTRELSLCQRSHSASLEGMDRDIRYIKRDAEKAEAATKAVSDCLFQIKDEVGAIKFATDHNSASVAELKLLVDNLPDRITKRINGGGKCSS